MKIAIAFFGLPRCTRICAPSIDKNIIEPLNRAGDIKVIYHLYEQSNIINSRSRENSPLSIENYDYFKQFEGFLSPPDIAINGNALQCWKKFGDAFGDDFNSLKNLRNQLISLANVTQLVEIYSPDIVLFVRPDLEYIDPISIRQIDFLANNPQACIIPNWQWWGGYNDRFAICGKLSYSTYGLRLHNAIEYCETTQRPLHAERLLRFTLRKHSIPTYSMPHRANRVRVNGLINDENFNAAETLAGGIILKIENYLSQIKSKRI